MYVIDAWLARQQKAHLCAASNIRAMPETEIPPVLRGDIYFVTSSSAVKRFISHSLANFPKICYNKFEKCKILGSSHEYSSESIQKRGETMEDKRLLRLLHKDPNAGMEQLMDQYAGLVYAVVRGKLSESFCVSSDIEDCVADVFSDFYGKLEKYDPKISSIKSYLCVLARYHAIDVFRKRERQRGEISIDDSESFIQISADERELDEAELRREVLAAVKDLGEPDTSIIIRKYYLGESSKQIARALKLTVSNVDTRTHRALNKLRKLFGGEEV